MQLVHKALLFLGQRPQFLRSQLRELSFIYDPGDRPGPSSQGRTTVQACHDHAGTGSLHPGTPMPRTGSHDITELLDEIARVRYYRPQTPRPSQPRVSKKPINKWQVDKAKQIAEAQFKSIGHRSPVVPTDLEFSAGRFHTDRHLGKRHGNRFKGQFVLSFCLTQRVNLSNVGIDWTIISKEGLTAFSRNIHKNSRKN